jgi:hypothetical protein
MSLLMDLLSAALPASGAKVRPVFFVFPTALASCAENVPGLIEGNDILTFLGAKTSFILSIRLSRPQ